MKKDLLVLLTSIFSAVFAEDIFRPTVTTTKGDVQGKRGFSYYGARFFSFKGIPYAEPPVGNLRFKNPVPKAAWAGVREAFNHGAVCPTPGYLGYIPQGEEDCLFLNVYTPVVKGVLPVEGTLPVMVWAYGGGFISGDGNDLVYGPDFFIKEGVILVTMNYRLGPFGFLSTGDNNAQGNYGVKDIKLALEWVRENIAAFGGDPNSITAFGQSAGAVSIHLIQISGNNNGLFHRAILQSGNGLAPFSFTENPLPKAEELGRSLHLQFDSNEELIEKLRAVDYKEILRVQRAFFHMDKPDSLRPYDFVPCVEPSDSTDDILLSDTPTNLMLNGVASSDSISWIIGTNSDEGLLNIREFLFNRKMFVQYKQDQSFYVPLSYGLPKNSPNVQVVADKFKELYFHGKDTSPKDPYDFAQFQTVAQFDFPTDRTVKMMSDGASPTIYYYKFSYDGCYNLVKTILLLKLYPGAAHADDLFYLFSPIFPLYGFICQNSKHVRDRHVRLFANFAKHGSPTPTIDNNLITVDWPKYNTEDEPYMDIGLDLEVKNHKTSLQVWHDFQQEFTGHL